MTPNAEKYITPQAQQYAGSAMVTLGLLDAFMSFGLLITRKNNGDTHYNWLGSDDYFVLSLLLIGGGLMAWAGKALYLTGYTQNILDTAPQLAITRVGHSRPNATPTVLHNQIHEHRDTAYKFALAASSTFLVMSFYAFLGGFGGSPTPESHIGPNQHKDNQMAAYCLLYGLTSIISAALLIKTAMQKSGFEHTHFSTPAS